MMDTLIIQDVRFKPKLPDVTENDGFVLEVMVDGTSLETSGTATTSVGENVWSMDVEFLVPTIADTFSFSFFRVDVSGEKSLWGAINISIRQIIDNSDVRKRHFTIQLETRDDSDEIADIGFSSVLSTSNYSAKPSPLAVLEIVKNMASEELIIFLTELVMSDVSCVNADTAILHAIYGAVASLPDDGVEKPRAFALLANIHVLRYDLYLQIAEEEATTQPMYAIYLTGLKRSLRLLEAAVSLAVPDHPKKPWMLVSLSMCIQRFITLQADDLDAFGASIHKLMGVVSSIPDEEPHKLQLLEFLGDILRRLFTQSNDPTNLDSSIAMFEDAIRLASDDTSKSSLLLELADSLSIRFDISHLPADISTSLLRRLEGLHLMSDHDAQKPTLLNHLGHAFFSRSQTFSDIEMTMKSIEAYECALLLIQDNRDHFERPSILNNIATSLQLRSQQLGALANPDDTRRIRQVLEDAVSLCLSNDPNKISYLLNLGRVLLEDTELRASTPDAKFVDRFVSILDTALPLAQDSSDDNISSLNKTAYSFLVQHNDLIQSDHIDSFFTLHRHIISLLRDDNGDKSVFLYQLTSAILRSQYPYTPTNIDKAIMMFEDAARFQQGARPPDALMLVDHGTAHLRRFERLGSLDDLNKAITILQQAISDSRLVPDYRKLTALNDLACAFFSRFNQCRDLADIDEGILIASDAALLATSTSQSVQKEWVSYRDEQFNRFVEYFQRFDDHSDLDVVTLALKTEVDALIDKATTPRLNSLGMYLSMRLKRLGNAGKIPAPVLAILVDSAQSIPDANPKKAMWLNMAGDLLSRRFKHTGDVSDLNQAIVIFETASQLTSDGLSPSPQSSNHLGCSLLHRFRWLGDLDDINMAIRVFEDALQICPDDHTMRHSLLTNLATSLLDRYLRLGDFSDFNQISLAITAARALSPKNPADADVVDSSIVLMLMYRTDLMGDLESLNTAIEIQKSISEKAPQNPENLVHQAMALLRRFRLLNEIEDVDTALELLDRALASPHDDSVLDLTKATILGERANAFSQRFVRFRQPEDINNCISSLRQAAELIPEFHPLKAHFLFDLGRWLPARFEILGDDEDLDDAFSCLFACASSITASIHRRFHAASLWAHWLRYFHRGNPMEAYSLSMDLIPQLAWLGHSVPMRHLRLLEAGQVVVDAVAAAIEADQYNTAIEWLEVGRTIVWSQLAELRAPAEGLASMHPGLCCSDQERGRSGVDHVTPCKLIKYAIRY